MVDATSSLLLGLEGLEVAAVSRWDGTRVVDVVTADPAAARCPGCRTISTSVKDHAVTRPRDIRYGDDPILLRWNKTRYRCVNPGCERGGVYPVIRSGLFWSPDCPGEGREGTMRIMAGRKRHSAEDIVRKLRRADELAAQGKTGEEIAADLEVSAATLYNWRRQYGGMDTDAAKELKELREQNGRLKRLLADAELEKDALREIAKGKF